MLYPVITTLSPWCAKCDIRWSENSLPHVRWQGLLEVSGLMDPSWNPVKWDLGFGHLNFDPGQNNHWMMLVQKQPLERTSVERWLGWATRGHNTAYLTMMRSALATQRAGTTQTSAGVTQHRLLRYDASRAMLTDEKGEITLQEKDRASWHHSHGGKADEAIDTQDPAFQMWKNILKNICKCILSCCCWLLFKYFHRFSQFAALFHHNLWWGTLWSTYS